MSRSLIAFVFVTLTLAASAVILRAQTVGDSLIIHLKSGERVAIPLSDIQKITFDTFRASVRSESLKDNLKISSHPNPFCREATIEFSIAAAGKVHISIFNARGLQVRAIRVNASAGLTTVQWDGRDEQGVAVNSGTYYAEVRYNSAVSTRELVVIR